MKLLMKLENIKLNISPHARLISSPLSSCRITNQTKHQTPKRQTLNTKTRQTPKRRTSNTKTPNTKHHTHTPKHQNAKTPNTKTPNPKPQIPKRQTPNTKTPNPKELFEEVLQGRKKAYGLQNPATVRCLFITVYSNFEDHNLTRCWVNQTKLSAGWGKA